MIVQARVTKVSSCHQRKKGDQRQAVGSARRRRRRRHGLDRHVENFELEVPPSGNSSKQPKTAKERSQALLKKQPGEGPKYF